MRRLTDKILMLDSYFCKWLLSTNRGSRVSMTSFRTLRFSFLLALSLLCVSKLYSQAAGVGCPAQSSNPSCTTASAQPSASAAAPQPRSSTLPRVTYRDGRLAITALNSSLGDVLRAVSTQTGAVIEFPADRAGDPFSAQAGPGPVRDVLATLFNGSRFNYVMLGSPTNPNLLQRMILTNAEQPAGSAPSVASGPPVIPQPAVNTADADNSEDGVPAVAAPLPLAQIANPEHLEAPKEPLSQEVLKQMVRDRMAARQQQAQPPPEPAQ